MTGRRYTKARGATSAGASSSAGTICNTGRRAGASEGSSTVRGRKVVCGAGAKAAVMGVSLFRGCDTPGGDGRLSPPRTLPRGISERSSQVLDTERMFGEHVCGEQPFDHSTRTSVRLSTIDHKKSPPCPQAARQGREGPTEVPMSDTLTTRQREILDCIVEHQNDRGYPRRCVRSARRSA